MLSNSKNRKIFLDNLLISLHSLIMLVLHTLFKNLYEGLSESNSFYFIILAHKISSRCCWYDNRSWIFQPITHNFFPRYK